MTITLDDVSCLLHFLVIGKSINHVPSLFDREAVKILLMSHMHIPTETEAFAATNVGVKMRLTWLEDLYHRYIE